MSAPPTVALLDYGSGNLRSAQRALERAGARVHLTADAAVCAAADGLVLPGVGAYAACMAGLRRVGGDHIVHERVASGRPLLAICVGLQVLFDEGVEHGDRSAGLGVLPGRVEALRAPVVPHMGWNTVTPPPDSILFAGVDGQTRFYFVHSYAVHPGPELTAGAAVTTAEHGEPFVAAVENNGISATQFHPEKSGDAGGQLLSRWVSTLSGAGG